MRPGLITCACRREPEMKTKHTVQIMHWAQERNESFPAHALVPQKATMKNKVSALSEGVGGGLAAVIKAKQQSEMAACVAAPLKYAGPKQCSKRFMVATGNCECVCAQQSGMDSVQTAPVGHTWS